MTRLRPHSLAASAMSYRLPIVGGQSQKEEP
jgi:hypothetical protein